jgi:curved DNA-binding protein CbpA
MESPNRNARPRPAQRKLYAKLAVSPSASTEDIKSAYAVLKQAYCPDGAYSDDVMQQAFLDISDAAEILTNSRTRKLYDRGLIDENGRRTEAGLAHASKTRTVIRRGALLVFGLASAVALHFLNANPTSSPNVAQGTDQTALHNEHSNVTSAASSLPKPSDAGPQTVAKADQPAIPEPSPATHGDRRAEVSKDTPPISGSSHAEGRSHDYLPPETTVNAQNGLPQTSGATGRVRGQGPQKSGVSPEPQRKRQAQSFDRRRRSTSLNSAAPDMWRSNIWLPESFSHASDPASVTPTLRTAQCLACLTNDRANCSARCP